MSNEPLAKGMMRRVGAIERRFLTRDGYCKRTGRYFGVGLPLYRAEYLYWKEVWPDVRRPQYSEFVESTCIVEVRAASLADARYLLPKEGPESMRWR